MTILKGAYKMPQHEPSGAERFCPRTGLNPGEINHDLAGFALQVVDRHRSAIARLQLVQQWDGVVVIDKAHGLAGRERIQRAKDGRMAEALGDTTGVKGVDGFGGGVIAGLGHGVFPFKR